MKHPSGKPVRERVIKSTPEPKARRVSPVITRLEPSTDQLAGGSGFELSRTPDYGWWDRGGMKRKIGFY